MSGGTSNHIVLMSTIDKGLTGSKVEHAFDEIHITLNKNTIVGDKSAMTPGGVRLGTPAVTTRGYLEKDIEEVARFIDEGIKVCLDVQKTSGKKLSEFKTGISQSQNVKDLAQEVKNFSTQFDIPGFDPSQIQI